MSPNDTTRGCKKRPIDEIKLTGRKRSLQESKVPVELISFQVKFAETLREIEEIVAADDLSRLKYNST